MSPPEHATGSVLGRLLEREMRIATLIGAWATRLWTRMWQDDILFLASGLAFNVLVCLLPVMLIWIYVLSIWLHSEETIRFAHRIIMAAFPNQPFTDAIRNGFSAVLGEMLLHKKSLGFISILVLVCTSASLFSSTRSALHRVFSVRPSRHLLLSYLLDITLVLGLTLLILGATTLAWLIRAIKRLQILFPTADRTELGTWSGMVTDLASMPILFLLCYMLYRYVPDERPSQRKALWAAFATSLIWEVSGRIFAIYLGSLTAYSKFYGAYAFVLVLMVWVFYSCFIFVLGAAAAQAAQEVRAGTRCPPKDSP